MIMTKRVVNVVSGEAVGQATLLEMVRVLCLWWLSANEILLDPEYKDYLVHIWATTSEEVTPPVSDQSVAEIPRSPAN